jgi:hypothetical protein
MTIAPGLVLPQVLQDLRRDCHFWLCASLRHLPAFACGLAASWTSYQQQERITEGYEDETKNNRRFSSVVPVQGETAQCSAKDHGQGMGRRFIVGLKQGEVEFTPARFSTKRLSR